MKIKVLLGNFGFGLGVTVISTIQMIVVTPLLIKEVGATVFGAWVMLADFFVAMQVFDFGITAYAAQRIASEYNRGNLKKVKGNFWASFLLVACLSMLMGILGVGLGEFFVKTGGLTAQDVSTITACAYIGLVAVGIQLIGYAFIAPSRALEKMLSVNVASFSAAVVGFISTIYMISAGFGLYSVAYGMLIRSIINLVGGVWGVVQTGVILDEWGVDIGSFLECAFDHIRQVPINFVSNFSAIGLASGDGLLIGYFIGFEHVTAYSVSKKVFDLVRTIFDVFSYSAYGGVASALSRLDLAARNAYVKNYASIVLWLSFLLVSGAYIISRDFILIWVGEDVYLGDVLMLALAASAFLGCFSSGLFGLARAAGKFTGAAQAALLELTAKLLIVFLLIKILGVIAIILAAAFGAVLGIAKYSKVLSVVPIELVTKMPVRTWYLAAGIVILKFASIQAADNLLLTWGFKFSALMLLIPLGVSLLKYAIHKLRVL